MGRRKITIKPIDDKKIKYVSLFLASLSANLSKEHI